MPSLPSILPPPAVPLVSAGREELRTATRLIGISSLIFTTGLLLSAAIFYAGRPFDWRAAIISDLQSPEENPRGYLLSALCTAITGGIYLRLLTIFYRRLRRHSVYRARLAATVFGAGAVGAAAIGCLAPFPHSYEQVHVPIAFATFGLLLAGLGLHLGLAARQLWTLDRRWGWIAFSGAALTLTIFGALVAIYRVEHFFNGQSLLTTLALWEWVLCGGIIGFLLLLVQALGRLTPPNLGEGSPSLPASSRTS